MVEKADVEKSVSELADWFRAEEPAGWRPSSVEFERDLGVVRTAGSRWELSAKVRGGGFAGGQFEIVIMIAQDEGQGSRGLIARRRMRLFEFLESTEKKMWRLHYGGSFHIDQHDGVCEGYFNKYVAGRKALCREIEKLAALRLT